MNAGQFSARSTGIWSQLDLDLDPEYFSDYNVTVEKKWLFSQFHFFPHVQNGDNQAYFLELLCH